MTAATAVAEPSTSGPAWPPIPPWQRSELVQLSQQGDLSGVTPRVLGVIDQAESSGTGGGITPSSGAGGFFGLVTGSPYAAGSPSAALLQATTQSAFADQAELSASAMSSYLGQTGGTLASAEEIYQTGSAGSPTEGSKLMSDYFGKGATTTGYDPWSGVGAVWGGITAATGGPDSHGASFTLNPIAGAEKSFTSFLGKAMLIVAGLGLVLLGAFRAASPQQRHAIERAVELAPEAAA